MELTIYQVDAFTSKLFHGNPAAVIPLDKWPDTSLLQSVALENNLSETAFFVPSERGDADFDIRWFTPTVEINLCGHATLASAFVLFYKLAFNQPEIRFSSASGILKVSKSGKGLRMDFPSWKPEVINDYPVVLKDILGGAVIKSVHKHRDLLVELEDEDAVAKCSPNFTLMKMYFDKVIITATGKTADFVSRFFAPGAGVYEDPVTGSAHSQLIPFWSERLGKTLMTAKQLSQRGGELICEQVNSDRVAMAGECVFYMKGEIYIS